MEANTFIMETFYPENDTNLAQDEPKVVFWAWFQIMCLILAIVGFLGNLLVVLVIVRQQRRRTSTDKLILGLAMADLLTSVFIIPIPTPKSLPFGALGEMYCKVIYSSVCMWISIMASVFTLTMISWERFVAVCYPFRYQRLFAGYRPDVIMIVIWVISFVINTNSFYVSFVDTPGVNCTVRFPTPEFQTFFGVVLFLVEYLIPVIIMLIANVYTIRALNQQARSLVAKRDKRSGPALKLLQARRKVIEMLFIVVITFVICWTPDQIGYLAFNLGFFEVDFLYSPVYRSFVALAFCNSCANPVIYAARNPNFRRALKELIMFSPIGGSVFNQGGPGFTDRFELSQTQGTIRGVLANGRKPSFQGGLKVPDPSPQTGSSM
ncbi:nociceptin receptor-like [Diadema antillarum]|uniref:nociceptin receptor-like n=1 Tax=Diadema antillarum TaxID=105358 RepID=UPI003A83777D